MSRLQPAEETETTTWFVELILIDVSFLQSFPHSVVMSYLSRVLWFVDVTASFLHSVVFI